MREKEQTDEAVYVNGEWNQVELGKKKKMSKLKSGKKGITFGMENRVFK